MLGTPETETSGEGLRCATRELSTRPRGLAQVRVVYWRKRGLIGIICSVNTHLLKGLIHLSHVRIVASV
mgnify:CR=1 FL=1|jgi:hypothetical protein